MRVEAVDGLGHVILRTPNLLTPEDKSAVDVSGSAEVRLLSSLAEEIDLELMATELTGVVPTELVELLLSDEALAIVAARADSILPLLVPGAFARELLEVAQNPGDGVGLADAVMEAMRFCNRTAFAHITSLDPVARLRWRLVVLAVAGAFGRRAEELARSREWPRVGDCLDDWLHEWQDEAYGEVEPPDPENYAHQRLDLAPPTEWQSVASETGE